MNKKHVFVPLWQQLPHSEFRLAAVCLGLCVAEPILLAHWLGEDEATFWWSVWPWHLFSLHAKWLRLIQCPTDMMHCWPPSNSSISTALISTASSQSVQVSFFVHQKCNNSQNCGYYHCHYRYNSNLTSTVNTLFKWATLKHIYFLHCTDLTGEREMYSAANSLRMLLKNTCKERNASITCK